MTNSISRRVLLGGLAGTIGGVALANAPAMSIAPKPRPDDFRKRSVALAETLIHEAKLGGSVGYVVANAITGEVLETHNGDVLMPPASVAKAVTTAYALDKLGADHRFFTKLLATGPITDGVLDGDLVLVGGGDPVLDTDALGEMAKTLKAQNLTRITGRFLVYGASLVQLRSIDPSQPDHLGYNPAISGLNLNYNRVHFEWKKAGQGYSVAMDARSKHFRPQVTMAKMQVVNRELPVYTYRAKPGVDEWTVARGALGNGGSRWLPVRKPESYAAEVFRAVSQAQGVKLPAPQVVSSLPSGVEIVSYESAPLSEIARGMLKYSTNLTAEVLGLSASAAATGTSPPSLLQSGQDMSRWLSLQIGADQSGFNDHSGLSDKSRISADDMVKLLVNQQADGALRALMKEIAPRDREGNKLQEAPYGVRAKTGTLNFVSSLAGYVTPEQGPPLVFAIFTGDIARRAKIQREDRERPEGARGWNKRAKRLQYQLIDRWSVLYGS